MIDTLSLLIAEAALIVTLVFGFVKFILPMAEKITRIDANTKNQKDNVERIEKKVDCLTNTVTNHESRIDELERKVL